VTRFEGLIRGVQERRQALKEQVDQRQGELDYLFENVHDAYTREERRQEEFAIEREISLVPNAAGIMPWSTVGESERRFRKSLLIALSWSLVLGIVIPLINVPIPDRVAMVVEIPERLAMLVKKEPPQPEPQRQRKLAKADAPEPDKPAEAAKTEPKTKPESAAKVAKAKPAAGGGGSPDARQTKCRWPDSAPRPG
jgi:hypothetical protein